MKKSFYNFLLMIIILGASAIRYQLVQSSYYPLNDGGLFFQMVVDLQDNHYQIPEYTTYNQSQIPFVYPPAPFFFVGLINSFLGFDLLQLFKYLPLVFNVFTIPIVSLLVYELTQNRQISLLATFLWSFALPSYQWQIMGGGITRSPALFFSLLSLVFISREFKTPSLRNLLLASVFAALTLLSHFEIFWNTALCMAVFWLFTSDKKKASISLLLIAISTLVLSLPYWLTIFRHHEIGTILNSISSGEFNIIKSVITLTLFNYMNEFSFTIISALAFIGLLQLVAKKNYLLPIWFILVVFFDPRSVNRSALLPLSIIAAMAIIDVILPTLVVATAGADKKSPNQSILLNPRIRMLYPILLVITICTFYASLVESVDMNGLTRDEEQDLVWIRTNTSIDSEFVVLSSSKIWQYDHVAEWFPTITGRKSVNTVQGSEWLNRGNYTQKLSEYNQLKRCYYEYEGCVTKWLDDTNLKADYLIVVKSPCSDAHPFCSNSMMLNLKNDKDYQIVYDSASATVFKK